MTRYFIDDVIEAVDRWGAVVRVVITRTQGSTPRDAGTSMIVAKDDFLGTIGGGKLEYQALDAARETHKPLRRYSIRQSFMQWAVQGLTVDDALAIDALRKALPRSVSASGSARTAVAHLVHTAEHSGLHDGALSAMDAVIAAQTAMMVSVIAASTVATTASSSSNGSGA